MVGARQFAAEVVVPSRPTHGLLLACIVVVLPAAKTAVLGTSPLLDEFQRTGDRAGFWTFWGLYLLAELVLVAAVVRARGLSKVVAALRPSPWTRRVGLAVVALTVVGAAARSIGLFDISDRGTTYNVQGASTNLQLWFLVLTVLLAVFAEEILFRWFAVSELADSGTPPVAAVLIPALGFGLFHLDFSVLGVVSAVCTGIGGVVLGVLVLRTRSIGWPLVLHLAAVAPFFLFAPVRIWG